MSRHEGRHSWYVGQIVALKDGSGAGEVVDMKFKNLKGNYSVTHVQVYWCESEKRKGLTTWVKVKDLD